MSPHLPCLLALARSDVGQGELKSDPGPKTQHLFQGPMWSSLPLTRKLYKHLHPGFDSFKWSTPRHQIFKAISKRAPGERQEECRLPGRSDVETHCELLAVNDQIRRRQDLRSHMAISCMVI